MKLTRTQLKQLIKEELEVGITELDEASRRDFLKLIGKGAAAAAGAAALGGVPKKAEAHPETGVPREEGKRVIETMIRADNAISNLSLVLTQAVSSLAANLNDPVLAKAEAIETRLENWRHGITKDKWGDIADEIIDVFS